jgi:hypothetical protein
MEGEGTDQPFRIKREGMDPQPPPAGQLMAGEGVGHIDVGTPERSAAARMALAPNAANYARNGGVAVVTTIQLFEALRQNQAGTFNETPFWKTVFETTGVAELDERTCRRHELLQRGVVAGDESSSSPLRR